MKKTLLACGLVLLMLFCSFGVMAADTDSETRYVVTFKDGQIPSSSQSRLSAEGELDEALRSDGEESWLVVDKETADALANDPNVESIEETGVSYLSYTPNDTYFDRQYALSMLNASAAWDYGYMGSSDLNVVVIDSGFDFNHEDKGLVKEGTDYLTGNQTIDLSHGTFCAGIIGAGLNNGIGMSGVLQYGNVYMIRCFYYDAQENGTVSDNYTISRAIRAAVDSYDADVISMSFGSKADDSVLREAINYARSKGVILVAASGNQGTAGSPLEYPAAYNGVIGVGSVDEDYGISYFSTRNSSVDVVAPGGSVFSLMTNNRYGTGSGTSYATPYVAALAGMALSYDSNLSASEFEQFLKKTSTDLGTTGYDYTYGSGLINYEAFMSDLTSGSFCDVPSDCWYESAVYEMSDAKIVEGRSRYIFDPENTTTRAEFVTMLARLSGDNIDQYNGTSHFTDVSSSSWFNKYINWAYEEGIVMGITENTFAPDAKINRAQMSTMMARYLDVKGIDLTVTDPDITFGDQSSIPDWAMESVMEMAQAGMLKGFDDGTFGPERNARRCEAVTILSRLTEASGS